MILLQVKNLHKSFAGEAVLRGVDFQIQRAERIGLIGRNGSGKTTLMRILSGEEIADEGDVFYARELSMGYLRQKAQQESSHQHVFDYCMEAFRALIKLWDDIQALALALSEDPENDSLLQELGSKQERFEAAGGYATESYVRGILKGLGFPEEDYNKPIHLLSGGERTRLELARTLVQPVDLLLLDEPTNHLDIRAIDWLENFLRGYPGALLIITHDREFLDRISSRIFELEMGVGHWYSGNYSTYVEEKRKHYELMEANYQHYLKRRAREEEKLRMFQQWSQRNDKFAARARDRERKLEKMEVVERPLWLNKDMKLHFESRQLSGRDVLEVSELSHGFGEDMLFSGLNFSVHRGDRLGIVGANGTGKTTLLNILRGRILPKQGSFQYGTGIEMGSYEQNFHFVSESNNLIEEVHEVLPWQDHAEIRHLLARFLFVGDDVFKQVKDLSGGERARLSLLKLMLAQDNLLLMDEPTNHLDLPSKETLEAALQQYPGTLIFVSHDRYFLNQLCTHILLLSEDGWQFNVGNYASLAKAEIPEEVPKQKKRPAHRREKKVEIKETPDRELELRLLLEEEKLKELQLALCEPEIYNNSESLADKSRQMQRQQELVDQLYRDWENQLKEL